MRFYYARSELTKLGLYLMLMLIIKITFSLLLIDRWGHNGLAMATSIAWFAGFILMSWDLGKRLEINYLKTIVPQVLKILMAMIVTTVLWLLFENYWPAGSNDTFIDMLLRVSVIIGLGGILYIILTTLLKLREPFIVLDLIRSKMSKNTN